MLENEGGEILERGDLLYTKYASLSDVASAEEPCKFGSDPLRPGNEIYVNKLYG
jgi:hypothetical protein